jgi:adenylosuccinate synthase
LVLEHSLTKLDVLDGFEIRVSYRDPVDGREWTTVRPTSVYERLEPVYDSLLEGRYRLPRLRAAVRRPRLRRTA